MEGGVLRRLSERSSDSVPVPGSRSSPLHLRICACFKKVLKKCIDTENRNLVSRAPGSEQTKDFYPVGSLSARTVVTTKTNETPGEKEHTIHVSTQSTQNVSFMRTRSGSLAAVPARVPSHPAYAGLLCAFAANPNPASSPIHPPQSRSRNCRRRV